MITEHLVMANLFGIWRQFYYISRFNRKIWQKYII